MSIVKKKKLKFGEIWDKGIRGVQFKPPFFFLNFFLLSLEIKFKTNLNYQMFFNSTFIYLKTFLKNSNLKFEKW
jgi:hypothetical protein